MMILRFVYSFSKYLLSTHLCSEYYFSSRDKIVNRKKSFMEFIIQCWIQIRKKHIHTHILPLTSTHVHVHIDLLIYMQ